MFVYDIVIKQPNRSLFTMDGDFITLPEQQIRIGTFFEKKPVVVRRAKHIQKVLGSQVVVSVVKLRVTYK